jgi:hypothetical protein
MRIQQHNPALALGVGEGIFLGRAFAFIGADAWKRPELA